MAWKEIYIPLLWALEKQKVTCWAHSQPSSGLETGRAEGKAASGKGDRPGTSPASEM